MSNEHELALRRRRECGRCNRLGTKFCDSANKCVCWSGYGGDYCERCTSEHSFISANGTCIPCPCDLHRSTGACSFDPTTDSVVCLRCIAGFAGVRCDSPDNSTTAAISTANPNGRINVRGGTTTIIVGSLSGTLLLLLLVLLLALRFRRRWAERRPLLPSQYRCDPERIQVNPNDVFFSIADYTELSPPERKRELPAAVKRNSAQFYFLSPNGYDHDKLIDDSDDDEKTSATRVERR